MGRVHARRISFGPVEHLARPLTLITGGFWIVALDLSFSAGGYSFDIINDVVGYALLMVGMWTLRAMSTNIVADSRAPSRFSFALGLAVPGLILAMARLVPAVQVWITPEVRSLGAVTDALCGAALLAGLALACDGARAPPVARSWRLSSRLWLWVFLPMILTALLVSEFGRPVPLPGGLEFAMVAAWLAIALAPVIHAHLSMVRTRRWRARPVTHCPACGYSLSGLPGPSCPECGLGFDSMGGPVAP